MITSFDIYILGFLYELKSALMTLIAAFIFITLMLLMTFCFMRVDGADTELIKRTSKTIKYSIITLVVLVILGIFAPNKETVIAMATVPPVLNNEKVQELPENVLDFINGWIKEYTPKNHEEHNSF